MSGVLEVVWATALGKSDGFRRPGPSIVFAVALVTSMAGLAFAMRDLPVSRPYAVWVGFGAVLTAACAIVFDGEQVSLVKIVLLLGIVGCVIGMKVLH